MLNDIGRVFMQIYTDLFAPICANPLLSAANKKLQLIRSLKMPADSAPN